MISIRKASLSQTSRNCEHITNAHGLIVHQNPPHHPAKVKLYAEKLCLGIPHYPD